MRERGREREKGTYVCISRKRKTEKEMSRRMFTIKLVVAISDTCVGK